MHARDHLVVAGYLAVMQQRDGTGFGGGIQGQQGGHRTGIQVRMKKSGSIEQQRRCVPRGPLCGLQTTTARKRAVVEVRQAPDQLRAARTLAVMASTEPTPSMWLYFGLPPLAADSFW